MVIYLDDITIFSKSDDQHLQHLERVFLKCKKFGISLNPKKSHFVLEECKLLGHIISKDGIKIDPQRVDAIQSLSIPRTKEEVQSFIGKVNFLRRFISNFAEIMKHITNMLRKENEIKWTFEARNSFSDIKNALTKAPVLISPDCTRDFQIFSFASEHTVAGVLLQKNEQGLEQPIAFYSKILRDVALKYDIMEKQAYALIKELKEFRVYILHSHVIAYVPSIAIKEILTRSDPDGRREKWIVVLLEYDLEIKPTKIIKGQGLAKFMTKSNYEALDINMMGIGFEIDSSSTIMFSQPEVFPNFLASVWYKDIIYVF